MPRKSRYVDIFVVSRMRDARTTHLFNHLFLRFQLFPGFPEANGSLPAALYRLIDPSAPVELPLPGSIKLSPADNRELDKLVAALGKSKTTWRRALVLHEWLQSIGHKADDRLCTTLIRVCAQHGQASTALGIYDWMRQPSEQGGSRLHCTVYTYTAAMRAALAGNMLDKAIAVWEDAEKEGHRDIDCRLCTTFIEVCTRRGDTDNALSMYRRMRQSPPGSKMSPTVHAYTAAMRAAADGGRWEEALAIWDDMQAAGCKPTGHAYSAVISACATGGEWQKAVSLFDEMLAWSIKPDVVSCTALVTALGTDGQWERAEKVVEWMLRNDIRPNVRTYTALVAALANAKQWHKATDIVKRMRSHSLGQGVEPNAYTYSALLKAMGDHGKWAMAEQLFSELEAEQLSIVALSVGQFNSHDGTGDAVVSDANGDALQGEEGDTTLTGISAGTTPLDHHHLRQEDQLDAGSLFETIVTRTAELALSEDIAEGAEDVGVCEDEKVGMRRVGSITILPQAEFSYFSSATLQQQQTGVALSNVHRFASRTTTDGLDVIQHGEAEGKENGRQWNPLGSDDPNIDNSVMTITQSPVVSLPSTPLSRSVLDHSLPTVSSSPKSTLSSGLSGIPASSLSPSAAAAAAEWTAETAAVQGLELDIGHAFEKLHDSNQANTNKNQQLSGSDAHHAQMVSLFATTPSLSSSPTITTTTSMPSKTRCTVNEVVCGALMLAYERSGKWEQAVAVLDRATALGIYPNTVMYNTAISALGKAGQLEAAHALFKVVPHPDAVTYETLIAAYGIAGKPKDAEALLENMKTAGFKPQDYAYCGLIAAHSMKGDWKAALAVRDRAAAAGVLPTVHMFNALIAACERAHQYEKAVAFGREMQSQGIGFNAITKELLDGVCKEGVKAVENQQAAIAALSAAVAAAGTVMMRAGVF